VSNAANRFLCGGLLTGILTKCSGFRWCQVNVLLASLSEQFRLDAVRSQGFVRQADFGTLTAQSPHCIFVLPTGRLIESVTIRPCCDTGHCSRTVGKLTRFGVGQGGTCILSLVEHFTL